MFVFLALLSSFVHAQQCQLPGSTCNCSETVPCNPLHLAVGCGGLANLTRPYQTLCGCSCSVATFAAETGICQKDPINTGASPYLCSSTPTYPPPDCPVFPGYTVVCWTVGPAFGFPVGGCCEYTAIPSTTSTASVSSTSTQSLSSTTTLTATQTPQPSASSSSTSVPLVSPSPTSVPSPSATAPLTRTSTISSSTTPATSAPTSGSGTGEVVEISIQIHKSQNSEEPESNDCGAGCVVLILVFSVLACVIVFAALASNQSGTAITRTRY